VKREKVYIIWLQIYFMKFKLSVNAEYQLVDLLTRNCQLSSKAFDN